jgi:hypothetical protein
VRLFSIQNNGEVGWMASSSVGSGCYLQRNASRTIWLIAEDEDGKVFVSPKYVAETLRTPMGRSKAYPHHESQEMAWLS